MAYDWEEGAVISPSYGFRAMNIPAWNNET